MIVRISTEGQYELSGDDAAELDRLDNEAVDACKVGNEAGFGESYARLLRFIRARGTTVAEDHLGASDLILPPPDVTLEEARSEFSGEGLLPG